MKKTIVLLVAIGLVLLLIPPIASGDSFVNYYGQNVLRIYGQVTVKNTHLDAYLWKATNNHSEARFSVDSAGTVTAVAYAATPGSTVSIDSLSSKVVAAGYHHSDMSPNVFVGTNYAGSITSKIDSAGKGTFVGLVTTGAITATSQTISSGAITATGMTTLDSLRIGKLSTGKRVVIDSVCAFGSDSLEIYIPNGLRAHVALKAD